MKHLNRLMALLITVTLFITVFAVPATAADTEKIVFAYMT